MSHTPGPWKQDTLGGTTVWGGGGKFAVAHATGFERTENIANARLIAAAPDLLRACQDALAFLTKPSSISPAQVVLRAAIAKATEAT